MKPAAENHAIILFDGVCNLCNGWVRFLIRRDRNHRFRFASIQSEAGKRLTREYQVRDPLGSLIFIRNGTVSRHSTAVLRILRELGFPYSLAALALLLPRPLRDAAYTFLADRRYRWFGKQPTCQPPPPEWTDRFLS